MTRSTPSKKTAKKTAKAAAKTAARSKVPNATGKTAKAPKVAKVKLVRDSFAMPETEYALIASTKKTCLSAGIEIKKSELIRIGIALVSGMSTAALKKAQAALQPVKTGRPKRQK